MYYICFTVSHCMCTYVCTCSSHILVAGYVWHIFSRSIYCYHPIWSMAMVGWGGVTASFGETSRIIATKGSKEAIRAASQICIQYYTNYRQRCEQRPEPVGSSNSIPNFKYRIQLLWNIDRQSKLPNLDLRLHFFWISIIFRQKTFTRPLLASC